jgi:quercetin dioxygenase-like cupin family protein
MRRLFSAAAALALVTAGAAFASSMAPTIVISGQEHWNPGTGMMKGAEVAVLAGNPAKPGLYIVRVKVPAGAVFGSHYHNETENVTVMSGTLWVGLGDKMNKAAMKPLTAGSFVEIPAKLHHYAMTKTATVFDITGIGPETMMAVKP